MSGNIKAEKKAPLVSIIMNCYNSEKYLKEAIDSIYAQTYKNWEIIFWDNASIDGSANIAKSYDEKLNYFKGDKTVPLYAGRNKALKKCSGKFIAFLDCDDLWLSGKLEKQIPFFNDENVGLVYGDSLFFNDQGVVARNFKKNKPYTGKCFGKLLKKYILDIETVVIRKSVLDEFNITFNDAFDLVGDAEIFLKVSFYSQLAYVPDVIAKWRIHQESLTSKKRHLFVGELEVMLSVLKKDLPDVNERFAKELCAAKDNIHIQRAKNYWKDSKNSMVRMTLNNVSCWRWKSTVLFFLSFVRYEWMKVLIRW